MIQRRWLKLVKDYDYDIWYYHRKANVVVDALSRKVMLSQITTYRELQKMIDKDQIELVSKVLVDLKI